MKYIKLFNSHTDYSDFTEDRLIRPNVSHCIEDQHVHYNPILDPFNGHEYVDLGLPSGTLWATMNVGATSETDTGLYFAWGDTQGYAANQSEFNQEDYIFSPYNNNTGYTKYNFIDGLDSLQPTDDAVTQSWGGKWQIPSNIQFNELFWNTQLAYISNYNNTGISGFILTGQNGNTIFLPISGYIQSGNLHNTGYFDTWIRDAFYSINNALYRSVYKTSDDGVYFDQGQMDKFSGMVLRGAIGNEVLTVNGYSNGFNFGTNSGYNRALGYDSTSNTYNLTLVLKEPINATEASFQTRVYNIDTSQYNPWISYSASSLDGGLTWTTQIPAEYADQMQLTLDNKSFIVLITNEGK